MPAFSPQLAYPGASALRTTRLWKVSLKDQAEKGSTASLPAASSQRFSVQMVISRLSFRLITIGRIDRKHRVTDRLAEVLSDRRDGAKVQHSTLDLLRQRAYQIACGYEDATDTNSLRDDAALQLALGRIPADDAALTSQPTLSRFEQRQHADLLRFSNACSTSGSSASSPVPGGPGSAHASFSTSTPPTS